MVNVVRGSKSLTSYVSGSSRCIVFIVHLDEGSATCHSQAKVLAQNIDIMFTFKNLKFFILVCELLTGMK